jgi:hypothetical protein
VTGRLGKAWRATKIARTIDRLISRSEDDDITAQWHFQMTLAIVFSI